MRRILVLILLTVSVGFAGAAELKEGENEVTFRAVYSDTDFGTIDGVDLGSSEDLDLSISYGWMLTDRHEMGIVAGYVKQDSDGGDLFTDESSDGTRLGGFYTYNFATTGIVTPYVGGVISSIGGDLGDAYDFQYAAEAGVKIYPFEHGGVSLGLSYAKFRSDANDLPDADSLNLGIGLILKY